MTQDTFLNKKKEYMPKERKNDNAATNNNQYKK